MAITIDHFPGRTLCTENGEYTYFGGTAYLGLQTHPEFLDRFREYLATAGTTYAASRNANVQLRPFHEGERWLANLTGAEDALYVSSGFAACQLVRKYLACSGHKLFFAPHTHAALLFPGDRNYASLEALRRDILAYLDSHPSLPPVLIFDTVDFTGGAPLDFEWLKTLPLQDLILVADDSHAIGITGEQGGGSFNILKAMDPEGLLVCGSMGKGFAITGGFLLGEKSVLKAIGGDPWFGGSGPGTMAGLQTLIGAEALLKAQRKKLHRNIKLFTTHCNTLHRFAWSEGYPCFTVTDDHLSDFLEERSMVVTNFHYPNADSPLMCKIVISAFHEENDILQLAEHLNSYYEKA
ncbi:aminotransferase class I/II-fold pyridoxal phosphate-dependent enzyme [Robertkochia sediminum]|uniref:aminotransferase class I/II-fold pyridoxal phosphate-dependent enzyme n=1 Tax=Robertkochia sediminum TaxID=2785326 RepID=UPI0019342E29|nr:aminotransferase class I/II-fold pyridoxal phosphate-dependent enzyme [Robertkochia sediminum]MBL7473763.1 aminotransferase class I/II-fold pyridoxal phosphate-dependent enzyme [Robertkochia sediminum]